MVLTITVKIEAETKQELVEHFGSQVAAVREHFDGMKEQGQFGDPNYVELRYLVIGGKWCGKVQPPAQQPEEPVTEDGPAES